MAITLTVTVFEVDEYAPDDKRIEYEGLDRSLMLNNVNQTLQLIRDDIKRILDGPPEKEE